MTPPTWLPVALRCLALAACPRQRERVHRAAVAARVDRAAVAAARERGPRLLSGAPRAR